jgi:transposase-like protein
VFCREVFTEIREVFKDEELEERTAWIKSLGKKERSKDVDQVVEKKEAQYCPTCNTSLQRTDGCNRMTCPLCNTQFHYETGQAYE